MENITLLVDSFKAFGSIIHILYRLMLEIDNVFNIKLSQHYFIYNMQFSY